MSKTRKNSRAKGANGERDAARYLARLGFIASRNARNGLSTADLHTADCPVLSKVWLEIKRDESFTIHSKALEDAMEQAWRAASEPRTLTYKPYAVLWRTNRAPWRLTFTAAEPGVLATVTGDARVAKVLRWLAQQGDAA